MKGTRKWEVKNLDETNLPFPIQRKLYNYLKINSLDGQFELVESDLLKICTSLNYSKLTIIGGFKKLQHTGHIVLLEKKSKYKRKISNGFEPGTKEYNYRCQIKHRYNMSSEDLNKLKELQDNKCAICRKEESKRFRLFVDHNHKTGKVRGLLCNSCNSAIGYFSDDIELMKSGIQYIINNK